MFVAVAAAQTPAPQPTKPPPPVRATTPVASAPRKPRPAQVVTVVHRLNGLKMFRLLLRSEQQAQVIASLDQAENLLEDVHTNVIAGLALDDGQTIVAWLPEAELELGPLSVFPKTNVRITEFGSIQGSTNTTPSERPAGTTFSDPELTVIGSDGRRWPAHYVGLDGATGLSVLRLTDKSRNQAGFANVSGVDVGQSVALFGPEPVNETPGMPARSFFVRMGEVDGTVWKINRTSTGGVARFKVRSPRINNAKVGGVALNGDGETIGIVDAVEGSEASILPADLIRRAADRVLSMKTSVPKPWLGVKGQAVATLSADQIENLGWDTNQATTLFADRRGILLTSIAPNSPAALATLKAGDVILKVNNEEIHNGEDFSWQLDQSDPGTDIEVTVARPGGQKAEKISVKLGSSLSPALAFPKMSAFSSNNFGLINQGVETIALRPVVAAQMGATGGLLVVYVEPATTAFEAGLKPGDIIQSIDGKPIMAGAQVLFLPSPMSKSHTIEVVRSKQKLVLTLAAPARK